MLLYEWSSKQNSNDMVHDCTEYQLQYELSSVVNQLLHLQTSSPKYENFQSIIPIIEYCSRSVAY